MMTTPLSLDPNFFDLLAESHMRFVGTSLVEAKMSRAAATRWLYEDAPFCVVAHNRDIDPCFIYANRMAQRCFEYDWDDMTALRSRLTAAPPDRDERDRLLQSVRRYGFATGYRGLRIARSGRQFWIEDVTVWNLVDREGIYRGQAATYRRWKDA